MKRKICIFSIIIVLGIMYIAGISIYTKSNINYRIYIEEINVSSLADAQRSYNNLFNIYNYENSEWTEQLKQEVLENEKSYLLVSIKYVIENNSKKVIMENMEFDIKFEEYLKDRVKASNKHHSTYILSAEPKSESGMTQDILIKADGLSASELYYKIIDEEIEFRCHARMGSNGTMIYKKFKVIDCLRN